MSHDFAPYVPSGARILPDTTTLLEIKDRMTSIDADPEVLSDVLSLIEIWKARREAVRPLSAIQTILQKIRCLPPSELRMKKMNTFVRTLGQSNHLAMFLEMLRESSRSKIDSERSLCERMSRSATRHSIYGWSAQLLLLESAEGSTEGTFPPENGLERRIGITTPEWGLSLHVWQPNLHAKPFPISKLDEPSLAIEPPHTHPFDFASYVVRGELHQTRYEQMTGATSGSRSRRYPNTEFSHVDGVWPPHMKSEKAALVELESRVRMVEGDSYFMPCNWIHDFDVDLEAAFAKPTITLFLSSEFIVMPHVYMAQSMEKFHRKHPNLKKSATALPEKTWDKCFEEISSYLRGEVGILRLNSTISYAGEYAFLHTAGAD